MSTWFFTGLSSICFSNGLGLIPSILDSGTNRGKKADNQMPAVEV
jgi:hypothetical protein